ncbi:MAG TPA: hypothetical protein VGJ05_21785 [Fimbriiglobus sp.]|jgi:hypothetical protein
MEWVTPHSEPLSKLALLESRLTRLRGAIKSGEGLTQLQKAAERVRLAQLSVIKAKLALIDEYPQRDPQGRQLANLRNQESQWQTLTVEAIIEQYGRPDA